jgi:hyperosmotically inducible protein
MRKLAGLASATALVFTVACGQTDAGITTAVKSKLAADDTVKAYQVDVDTSNKVVTLSGDVETSAQKEHAVTIARNTDGVTDVIDRLRVNPTAATSGRVGDIDVRGDVDVDVDNDVEAAAKRGAEATKRGAEKTGEAIKDVFTDDDRDSDNDGK